MRKRFLKVFMVSSVLSGLVLMSGCSEKGSSDGEASTTKTTVASESYDVEETVYINYGITKTSDYINNSSGFGYALKFEIEFNDRTPACEAYVYNDMSSLVNAEVVEENNERYEKAKEENPDISEEELLTEKTSLWYETVFYSSVNYDAAKSVEIQWVPAPAEENASKYSSEEEYLKTGYMYLVLKEEENITGYMVFEFPAEADSESGEIEYTGINIIKAAVFEKVDGEYQNVSMDYVKSCVDTAIQEQESE